MRLPIILSISMVLAGCVSSSTQQQVQPLPPANVGDTRATAVVPPPSIAPSPSGTKRITYNGAGGLSAVSAHETDRVS
jgi:PBP1b-binding outer membrane lipoprotein LpoB